MTEIIPHTNTLIVDIGTKYTKIGYSGNFHPTYVFKTSEKHKLTCDAICKTLEKYLKECDVDSLIYIENSSFESENKPKILKFLFGNKLCNSVLFLASPLADAFGFGKISGTVLCCSASSFSASTIINGKVVETYKLEGGCIQFENIIENTMANIKDQNDILRDIKSDDSSRALCNVLESTEAIDILKTKYNTDIFSAIKTTILPFIDKILNARAKYYINKKNAANGCIMLSGGLFRFDSFYNFVKSLILERIGADFSDFILREKDLNCTFVGASVFGMNNQTKPMFITTYDWQNIGNEILKFKMF